MRKPSFLCLPFGLLIANNRFLNQAWKTKNYLRADLKYRQFWEDGMSLLPLHCSIFSNPYKSQTTILFSNPQKPQTTILFPHHDSWRNPRTLWFFYDSLYLHERVFHMFHDTTIATIFSENTSQKLFKKLAKISFCAFFKFVALFLKSSSKINGILKEFLIWEQLCLSFYLIPIH